MVIGWSAGIGLQTARRAHEEGANVILRLIPGANADPTGATYDIDGGERFVAA